MIRVGCGDALLPGFSTLSWYISESAWTMFEGKYLDIEQLLGKAFECWTIFEERHPSIEQCLKKAIRVLGNVWGKIFEYRTMFEEVFLGIGQCLKNST